MPFRHTMEQGCRRQGCRWCKLTPKSFDLMEIWAKAVEIWENLWKPLQNPWKSGQTPWTYVQKWRPMWFDLKKMTPNICRITWRPFFGGYPKNGLYGKTFAQKVAQNFFGQVWRNLGKNLLHPKNLPAPTPVLWSHFAHRLDFMWAKSFVGELICGGIGVWVEWP